MTQPLTREPSRHTTEAWHMATADGLAVAFRYLQPPGFPAPGSGPSVVITAMWIA